MHEIVAVNDFGMKFGPRAVIDDLSFSLARGETFGFLGGNGSGNTTTIRALLGLTQPTRGTLLIDGAMHSPTAATRVGYLPEERGLYRKERVLDVMVYLGELKHMRRSEARKWSLGYLERVGLGQHAGTRLDRLSGGQQQKIQLGVTIMDEPDLLILDEPTKGLDPVNRRLLMELVEERRQTGAAVILVSHHMDEVERLCDRILLLKDGRAHAYGTVPDVQDAFGPAKALVSYTGADQVPTSALYVVDNDRAGAATLQPAPGVEPHQVLRELVQYGVGVEQFNVRRTPLESIFISVYGEQEAAA